MDERAQIIEHILHLNTRMIDQHLSDVQVGQASWLSIPITMTQFKTLLLVAKFSNATVGQLAKGIGVGLPTMSGIVDRLYEQGLVTRTEDPDDRRIARIATTEKSRELLNALYNNGVSQWRRLLERLDSEALQTVAKAIDLLNLASLAAEAEQHTTASATS